MSVGRATVTDLEIAGDLSSRELTLEGSGVVTGVVEETSRLVWAPKGEPRELTLGDSEGRLEVAGRQLDLPDRLVVEHGLASLALTGFLQLRPSVDDGETVSVARLTFTPDARLEIVDGSWHVGALASPKNSLDLCLRDYAILEAVVGAAAPRGLRVFGAGELLLTPDGGDPPPTVDQVVLGGDVTLTADLAIDRLQCIPEAGEFPGLNVQANGVVRSLDGTLRLGLVAGRVAARADRPAVIVSLAGQSESAVGQVVGVDPAPLSYGELDHIEGLFVFEPSATALRQIADESLGEFEARERAEWATKLVRVVAGRANSGASRAAAHWTAARLQHRALQRGSENLGRTVHRWLGYGYKPSWPFALWVAASAVVALFAMDPLPFAGDVGLCRESETVSDQAGSSIAEVPTCVSGGLAYLEELVRVMFFPFRVLRLTDDSDPFRFLPDWVSPVAGLAVGAPFLFGLLALRNYFRSPVEDH